MSISSWLGVRTPLSLTPPTACAPATRPWMSIRSSSSPRRGSRCSWSTPMATTGTWGVWSIDFDERGLALPESIGPHVSGAYATDRQGGQTFAGPPIPEVTRIVQSLRRVLRDRVGTIVSRTSVYLAGDRGDVRTQETNLGNLTGDANLWFARQIDAELAVSFKNGGGIRSSIGLVVQPPGTTSPADVSVPSAAGQPRRGQGRRRYLPVRHRRRSALSTTDW